MPALGEGGWASLPHRAQVRVDTIFWLSCRDSGLLVGTLAPKRSICAIIRSLGIICPHEGLLWVYWASCHSGIFPGLLSLAFCPPSEPGLFSRHDVHAALTALRTSRWVDHSTRAVSVHFTLYNPPTRLFTSVTLGAELLPTGGLVPSSLVESISIYGDSAPRYLLMLSEVSPPALGLLGRHRELGLHMTKFFCRLNTFYPHEARAFPLTHPHNYYYIPST